MNEPVAAGAPASRSTDYRSYLLRLWSRDRCGDGGWQASLEDPHTGERIGFASLEELFIFLVEQVEGSAERERPA